MRINRTIGCILFFAFAGLANAAVIAQWENDHLAGTEASTTAGEGTSNGSWSSFLDSAPVLGRGPGGTATAYINTFGMRNANETSLANAIANNRYWTFTLTLGDKADWMNITNIFVRLQAQDATSYPVYFTLMSDKTGYTAGSELITWTVGGTGNSAHWLGQQRSVNLSGVSALQNITDDVTFRLYAYGQPGAFTQVGIGRAFQTNGSADLIVYGDIVVLPEPGAIGLIGLGCIMAALLKRRVSRLAVPHDPVH